jgi:protein-S-isoprenylcysteine O-methyltransferase Ste14
MIAFGGLVFLIFLTFLRERKLHKVGIDTKGSLPISRPLFILAKLSLLVCWLSILIQSGGGNLRYYFDFNNYIVPIAVALEMLGIIIVFKGMAALGECNSMGLLKDSTKLTNLKIEGVLRLTRNPIYLGNNIICIAAVLFTYNPIVLFAALISILIHHKIILAEENFLSESFKDEYLGYRSKVNRYF